MVNQAEQPDAVQAPLPETGNTTTDITSDFEGVNTFEDVDTSSQDVDTSGTSDTPEATEESNTEQPVADTQPVTGTTETTPTPAPVPQPEVSPNDTPVPNENLQNRINKLEEQATNYQNMVYQNQLQGDMQKHIQQLETQGYLPEQAQQIAQSAMVQRNQAYQAQQQYEQQVKFYQGQQAAAEHFAGKYDLKMSDLTELKKYPDPQSMESAAKDIKRIRGLEEENARLKAERVQPQTFDNSQSTPAASTDEDRWLERYNQGDRSTQAQAAARRAAGLG